MVLLTSKVIVIANQFFMKDHAPVTTRRAACLPDESGYRHTGEKGSFYTRQSLEGQPRHPSQAAEYRLK